MQTVMNGAFNVQELQGGVTEMLPSSIKFLPQKTNLFWRFFRRISTIFFNPVISRILNAREDYL